MLDGNQYPLPAAASKTLTQTDGKFCIRPAHCLPPKLTANMPPAPRKSQNRWG